MVVDIGAGYDMTSFDPGLFIVSAQMRPGVKVADTQAEVEKESRGDARQSGRRRRTAEGQES